MIGEKEILETFKYDKIVSFYKDCTVRLNQCHCGGDTMLQWKRLKSISLNIKTLQNEKEKNI
jgi:hypothetical protein